MTNSNNYGELKWAWTQWREKSGKLMRSEYKNYVELVNKAAKLNGDKNLINSRKNSIKAFLVVNYFLGKNDNGELWRESYEDDNFVANVDKMWIKVEPLYRELHTYVKRKLQKIYEKEMDKDSDLIPAHLLGNMWAQSWVNLYDRTKPFANGSLIDITAKLNKTRTILQMFEESDKFYKGLGLEPNDMSYNESLGAVIRKPDDRVITCHASVI